MMLKRGEIARLKKKYARWVVESLEEVEVSVHLWLSLCKRHSADKSYWIWVYYCVLYILRTHIPNFSSLLLKSLLPDRMQLLVGNWTQSLVSVNLYVLFSRMSLKRLSRWRTRLFNSPRVAAPRAQSAGSSFVQAPSNLHRSVSQHSGTSLARPGTCRNVFCVSRARLCRAAWSRVGTLCPAEILHGSWLSIIQGMRCGVCVVRCCWVMLGRGS